MDALLATKPERLNFVVAFLAPVDQMFRIVCRRDGIGPTGVLRSPIERRVVIEAKLTHVATLGLGELPERHL